MPRLTIVGPFSGNNGHAEFARLFRTDLEAAHLQADYVDVDLKALASHERVDLADLPRADGPVLFLVNPPEFLPLARQLGHSFFAGRPAMALWWWESSRFPPEWTVAARLLDEVWAASDYTCTHLATAVGHVVRCPLPRAALQPRASVPSMANARFLVTFDYRSTVERKNPAGALEAYLRAFPVPRAGVSLTLKSMAAERVPFEARRLRRLASGRPDVTILDQVLPRQDLEALFAASGCYVSLHRAEGLGLGLLEAMRDGKPVIATGFSGNMQFTPPDYPLLVRWRPRRVPRSTPLYGRLGGPWAEPDLDHAAGLMRRVAEDPAWTAALARQAQDHLRDLAADEDLAAFVQERVRQARVGPRPAAGDAVWATPPRQVRRLALVDRWDRRLRRFPPVHKLCMDLFYGRYDPRPRR